MTTFTLEIVGPALPWMNAQHTLTPGWNHIGDSFGVRLFEIAPNVWALERDNGAVGIGATGGFFYDYMILRCDTFMDAAPRIGQAVTRSTSGEYQIRMGNGQEYFPPRARKITRFVTIPWWRRLWSFVSGWLTADREPWRVCYNIRPKVTRHEFLALPRSLAVQKAVYDEKGERILRALRTGKPDESVELYNPCGEWMPMGLMDKGAVGGGGIEPFPGFELSSLYRILSHDLTMERHAVSFVDAATGKPITTQRSGYRATRGWGKLTQLAEFCRPLTGHASEDQRTPIDLNSGTCPYRDKFVPSDTLEGFYGQRYSAIDDEHLVRATRHAKCAAILYGDPVAKGDLEMIAADGWIGVQLLPATYPESQGTDAYGRGLAWICNALQACDADWAFTASITITGALLRVQHTETGSYQAFKSGVNYGHSPSPWAMPPQYGASLPAELDAAHTLEVAYLATCAAHSGYWNSAEKAARFVFYVQPKQWIGVVWPPTEQVGNVESFSCWGLIAVLAARDPAWIRVMQRMVPPGAPVVAGPDVRGALLAAGNFEASAKALEVLE